MIAWLRGVVREKRPPNLLLDVNGVGYELEAPMTTFYDLPDLGREIALFTHQVVREDAHSLYGFANESERNVFRLLLRVNGVGAKLALAILSGMDAGSFARCVYEGDAQRLVQLPGVGRKTAERLVMEMRDRFDALPNIFHTRSPADALGQAQAADPKKEAINALVALGFKVNDAAGKVEALDCTGLACEEIILQALKSLAK